jgi:hypothetical protein
LHNTNKQLQVHGSQPTQTEDAGRRRSDLDYYIAKDFAEERPPPRNFVGKLRNTVQFQKKSEVELLEQEVEELRTSHAEVTEERDALRMEHLAGSRDSMRTCWRRTRGCNEK